MNSGWCKVLAAAIFEVGWVIGLKHADGFGDWTATLVALAITSFCLITAGDTLPVGTSYSVFVGLGTAGTAVMETALFDVPLSPAKTVLLALLLTGVIGLKLVTPKQPVQRRT